MVRATSAFDGDHVSIAKRGIRNQLDDYETDAQPETETETEAQPDAE